MSGVFISYRREDSRGETGRLNKDLKDHLADNQIFRDIDTIEPGVDFTHAIDSAVSSSNALLAVIGPDWLNVTDGSGKPRLDNPDDYVRLEIEAALNRDIRVIPVLVGDAKLPQSSQLPTSLKTLARRHSHELSEHRWDYDVDNLAAALLKIPGIKGQGKRKSTTVQASMGSGTNPIARFGRFAGAAVLSAMGVMFLLAGVIEGEALAFFWAIVFLGGAYWLYRK